MIACPGGSLLPGPLSLIQLLLAFRQRSPCNTLNKRASEGLHACLHFPVPPQVVVTGNFWIIAFSLFSFRHLFYPLVRPQRGTERPGEGTSRMQELSLAVHTVALWWWVCNRQDKGIYAVEENKGAKKRKKAQTGALTVPGCGAPVSVLSEEACLWGGKLSRSVGVPTCKRISQHSFHFISLLFLGNFADVEGSSRRSVTVITQSLQRVLFVLTGWFTISMEYDF